MKEIVRYHTNVYFKSNKIIMPLLLWIAFLKISYSQTGLSYVPDIVMSSGCLFFIMIWIGFGCMDIENPISEQILIIKVKNADRYYISKIVFLLLIGLGMSAIGVVIPLLINIMNGYRLFNRTITLEDILCGLLLLFILAFLEVQH
jgi:hypothetical protein